MFSFMVKYGTGYSCVMGSAATLEKTLAARDEHIAYYQDIGERVTDATIEEICGACEGTGHTGCKHATHKRGFRPARCIKICQTCLGSRVFPVDLPAKWKANLF